MEHARYISKQYNSSTTIPLEAPLATLAVDAYAGRGVRIFDVPGAYLNVGISDEKDFRLKFEGEFVDIMCNMNLDHIPNIRF